MLFERLLSAAGSAADWIDQREPFQRSISGEVRCEPRRWYSPTAMHERADPHATPCSPLDELPAGSSNR
jgi:hypothetical protein